MTDLSQKIQAALLSVDAITARQLIADALTRYTAWDLMEGPLTEALEHIGAGWEDGTYALAQVYMSSRISEQIVEELLPTISASSVASSTLAIAVLEDHHLLGKRIVSAMLRSVGHPLRDFGRMEMQPLAQRVRDEGITTLLVSVLMLPSALQVRQLRDTFTEWNYPVQLVVGGAPFRMDRALWRQVGADAVGYTASDALRIVKELRGGISP